VTGEIETISHAQSISPKSLTARHGSEYRNRKHRLARSGKISPHQGASVSSGFCEKTTKEAIEARQSQ
jgi:hypothetical protein